MKKNIKLYMALVLGLYMANSYSALSEFYKGTGVDETNISLIAKDSLEYAISRKGQISVNDDGVDAFLRVPNTINLYSLSSSNKIYLTNFDTRTLQDQWPLTRWSHQYASSEVAAHYKELFLDYPLPFDYESTGPGIGCYGNTPLRYGDIENDTKNELVIILNTLFMVFSVEHKKIVFAEYLDASDWFTTAEKLEFFADEEITTTQYVSQLMAENDRVDPGVRAYAKLYFGDFDKDGNSDILAWRKSYRSNAVSNPVAGFTKQGDSWQHFERSNDAASTGEYMPQVTDTETIKAWLSAGQLTWKKGYPSLSECPGQETQLIPEMHDTLLNDPEVLQ